MLEPTLLRKSLAAMFLLSLCGGSSALEPRDYGTYDPIGLIPYEAIKMPSAAVKRAMQIEKGGDLREAYNEYWAAYKKTPSDSQTVFGVARCAKQLHWGDKAIRGVRRLVSDGKRYRRLDYLLIGLVRYDADEDISDELRDVPYESYVKLAYSQARDDLGVRIAYSLVTSDYGVKRTILESLRKEYPTSEGIAYLLAMAWAGGPIARLTMENGKVVDITGGKQKPNREKALEVVRPYLNKNQVPIWARYAAAAIYHGLGKKDAAKKHAAFVHAAKGDCRAYRLWVQKLGKGGM